MTTLAFKGLPNVKIFLVSQQLAIQQEIWFILFMTGQQFS